MGKRKERRLAAFSNAGRRVKLDLFAEPSGDTGGSSVNGEIVQNIDSTKQAGFPNSPSSSSSSGQYSDNELDEESSKRPNQADAENCSSKHGGLEGRPNEVKEVDANAVKDSTSQKGELCNMEGDSTPSDVLQSLGGGDSGESDDALTDKGKAIDSAKEFFVTGASNAQVNADVGLGWRMVMHEESNQYYYWNIETGETSWEVPGVLAQTTQLLSHNTVVPPAENVETTPVDINQSNSTLGTELDGCSAALAEGGSVGASLASQSQEAHVNEPKMNEWVEGYQNGSVNDKIHAADACQSEPQSSLSAANALLSGEVTNSELENGMDLSTNLMKQCESLLERLKSLKGYGSRLQCQDQMSKYIFEVDIRLSDIKSLSSCAASLLPFWFHTQRRLKQLEDIINIEIYHLAVSAQMDDDFDVTTNGSNEKEKCSDIIGRDSDADGCESNRKLELPNSTTAVVNDLHNDLPGENKNARHVLSVELSNEYLKGAAVGEKVDGTACPEPEFHPGEDVDMDVDMEVDDGVSTSITGLEDALDVKGSDPIRQLSQPNTPTEYATLASGDGCAVPLPPEEAWIPPPPPDSDQVPPPPPDNEQVPPPPPDELPESSHPPVPSYMEPVQPLPYAEQYNLSYPASNFQYYGTTVPIPGSNLYGNNDGCQIVVPHASVYYEPVANTFSETAPVIVSPVDPGGYYNIQDGSLAPVPVVRNTKSSHSQSTSCAVGYSSLASDQIRTVGESIDAPRPVASETFTASVGVTSTSVITAPATADVKENISASSTNVVTASATVSTTMAASKSKVARGKKRTVAVAPSLRSNKKVSSLVDKWKAAKEELNEIEEDEPKNAYEMLERKKQREIEEWHAKQIASGEAKDNANFQPLGGDWRERVKRRRAQQAKEAEAALSEAPRVENQKPDLAELSKGLPSGWQAYWDEESKQVYYGNLITSETTWNKPSK